MQELAIALGTAIIIGFLGCLGFLGYFLHAWRQEVKQLIDSTQKFSLEAIETVRAENAVDKAQADNIRESMHGEIARLQHELWDQRNKPADAIGSQFTEDANNLMSGLPIIKTSDKKTLTPLDF